MRKSLIALTLATLTLTTTAQAELLINGDFETVGTPNQSFPGYNVYLGSQLPGWTLSDTPTFHAVTVHDSSIYPFITGHSVNMDGEGFSGVNADFSQTFPTLAGQEYSLKYQFKAWQNTSLQLFVDLTDAVTTSLLAHGINNVTSTDVTSIDTRFIGTGNPITLRIYETPTGVNDNGIITDNFSITEVPEPTTALAALPALALLGRGGRRR